MTDVIVERLLPQPLEDDDLRAMQQGALGCFDIHRVEWLGSLVSSDRCATFCHFRGPDAESVRIALRQSGAPTGLAWACRVHDAPGLSEAGLGAVTAVVLHAFDEPAEAHAREVSEVVDMGCFQLHRVHRLRSYLSTDRLRLLALYAAPDAESVRLAQRRAGLPSDRIVAVRRFVC